jgi:hypothetical protein
LPDDAEEEVLDAKQMIESETGPKIKSKIILVIHKLIFRG